MSMLQHSTRAWGSPSRYIQGRYELENMKTHTEVYGRTMKHTIYALTMFALAACTSPKEKAIDRHALVTRNNPEVLSKIRNVIRLLRIQPKPMLLRCKHSRKKTLFSMTEI